MRSRRNKYILLWVCAVFLLSAMGGCGYTTKVMLPSDIKTIHVEIFKNNIGITKEVSAKDRYEVYRPGLEVDVRDAVIGRIFLDGHLRLESYDKADSILEGEIIEYRKDPLRYQNENVTEYNISLVCDIRLKGLEDSNILLEEKSITGEATYFTTGSLQTSETTALNAAASDLARQIVNRIVENW